MVVAVVNSCFEKCQKSAVIFKKNCSPDRKLHAKSECLLKIAYCALDAYEMATALEQFVNTVRNLSLQGE